MLVSGRLAGPRGVRAGPIGALAGFKVKYVEQGEIVFYGVVKVAELAPTGGRRYWLR